MKPEDQQLEIQKFMGLVYCGDDPKNHRWDTTWYQYSGNLPGQWRRCLECQAVQQNHENDVSIDPDNKPPCYLKDLNAINTAESELIKKQRQVGQDRNNRLFGCWSRYVGLVSKLKSFYGEEIHASASQKAKLFLMAIGKWKE